MVVYMENATETTEVFTLVAVMALYGHSTSQSNTTAIGFKVAGQPCVAPARSTNVMRFILISPAVYVNN